MAIRRLPEHVVRRIRAGEVVDRPASLVKELIENSLDAGASAIKVEILGAGTTRILVSDDGCGMSAEDLTLCTERHATSKFDGDDIDLVATLGFRGEALAAASAMARITIRTRRPLDDHAWMIVAEDGRCGVAEPCSGVPGTTVEALGLFSSHPARAGFLSSPRYETSRIAEVVEAAALTRPDVAFSLKVNGKVVYSFPVADWDRRVSTVIGVNFFNSSLPFQGGAEGMTVRGRIGSPNWSGHGNVNQMLVVNGRPVRDEVVASALKAAFAPLSRETAPAAIVELWLPTGLVDINVHPTKAAVKFRHPLAVHELVRSAASSALSGGGTLAASVLSAAALLAAQPVRLGAGGDSRRLPLGRALGLTMGTYIVSEAVDRLILTDAHAAHERIVHERLKALALAEGVPTRRLPMPVVVEVGDKAAALVELRADALGRLGLGVQILDGGVVAINSIPAVLPDSGARDLMESVAKGLLADAGSDPLGQRLDEICALVSCHAAIRDGDDVSPERADLLLRELEATPNNSTCMHGRPLSIFLPIGGVAKLFGR